MKATNPQQKRIDNIVESVDEAVKKLRFYLKPEKR